MKAFFAADGKSERRAEPSRAEPAREEWRACLDAETGAMYYLEVFHAHTHTHPGEFKC